MSLLNVTVKQIPGKLMKKETVTTYFRYCAATQPS